jgi:hypothetical protein
MKKGTSFTGAFLASAALSALLVGCASTPAPRFVPPKPDPNLIGVPENIANVFKNANEICGPITGGAKNPVVEMQIQRFRMLLNKSKTGATMLENASSVPDSEPYKTRPLWVCFEKMKAVMSPYAYYSWGRGVMVINTHMYDEPVTEGKQISAAIHELRHAEQDKAFNAVRYKDKTEAIISTYASEADAEAINILVQWEMKEAGYSVPWYVRATPSNFIQGDFCFSDMHRAFEDAIQNGGDKKDATRAAFRAWHDYKSILNSYQGQGNMRWGMQEVQEKQKEKWAKEDAERAAEKRQREAARQNRANANADETSRDPRILPDRKPGVFLRHTWQTGSMPRNETELALDLPIPSQALSDALDKMGPLPDGSGNYLKDGGGVRKILQNPLNKAASLRP